MVSAGDTTICRLDFQDGTQLTIDDDSVEVGTSDGSVAPGEYVELRFSFDLETGSHHTILNQYIALGLDSLVQDAQLIRRSGSVARTSGWVGGRLQAPEQSGIYQVYAMLVNGYMTREALEAYSNQFEEEAVDYCYIRIGTITVR
ncbi:hypothetical protein ACFL6R_01820 [Gemmatimonadota bacterium]